jgi:hypothetical protein
MIICVLVASIAALMFSTAIALRRQLPLGRKLGLLTSLILMLVFFPFGVYGWWFLTSDRGKEMYSVKPG